MANKGMINIENISQLNETNKGVADVIAVVVDPDKSKSTIIYIFKYTKFNIFPAF